MINTGIYTEIFCGCGFNENDAIHNIEKDVNEYIKEYKIKKGDIINYSIKGHTNPNSFYDIEIILSYWSEI